MSHCWKRNMTLVIWVLCSFAVLAQSSSRRVSIRTGPTEVSVTTEAIPLHDSLGMNPYLDLERFSETRPGVRESEVEEVSITRDALPITGDSMPSAVKGTASASTSSTKSSITSVNVPPVDAIPADQSRPMAPKVAVRASE